MVKGLVTVYRGVYPVLKKEKKRKEILFSKCFTKKEGRRRGERQICLDPDGVGVSTFRKLSFLLGFAYLLRQDLIM